MTPLSKQQRYDNPRWDATAAVLRSGHALKEAIAKELTIGSPEVEQALREYNEAIKTYKRLSK